MHFIWIFGSLKCCKRNADVKFCGRGPIIQEHRLENQRLPINDRWRKCNCTIEKAEVFPERCCLSNCLPAKWLHWSGSLSFSDLLLATATKKIENAKKRQDMGKTYYVHRSVAFERGIFHQIIKHVNEKCLIMPTFKPIMISNVPTFCESPFFGFYYYYHYNNMGVFTIC